MKLTRHVIMKSDHLNQPDESFMEINLDDITDMEFTPYVDVVTGDDNLVITLHVDVLELDHETNKIMENKRTVYLDSWNGSRTLNTDFIMDKYELALVDDDGKDIMRFDRPTKVELFMIYHYLEIEGTLLRC